jgi:pimeloyl-ACP methyl ester carboxylesterase
MTALRRFRRLILFVVSLLILYVGFCAVAGVFVADGTLHPARRPLTHEEETTMRQAVDAIGAGIENVSITAQDSVVLSAWILESRQSNGEAVLLLHGLADNRIGMTGYARLLLAHGFAVLLPDSRAHGRSGGALATYGLLERNDVHQWFDWLAAREHPRCIFGFGESMGAAQLLQSLNTGTHFCAVAVESPFSNFREIAYDRMGQPFHLGPWLGRTLLRPLVEVAFLRARWEFKLNMERISPEETLAASRIPVFLIHGQHDTNIPVRHSRRLKLRNPSVVLWEVPNADHCGAISAAPREFEQRLLDWFSIHSRQQN